LAKFNADYILVKKYEMVLLFNSYLLLLLSQIIKLDKISLSFRRTQ